MNFFITYSRFFSCSWARLISLFVFGLLDELELLPLSPVTYFFPLTRSMRHSINVSSFVKHSFNYQDVVRHYIYFHFLKHSTSVFSNEREIHLIQCYNQNNKHLKQSPFF
jgi:hypothetical protein